MYRFYSKTGGPRVALLGFHENGKLKIAAARCSEKDAFCKKKGIEQAQKRADKKKFVFEGDFEEMDGKTFVKVASIVSDVVLHTKAVTSR